ncbi:MAG: HEAT repeat domain-containing protein [Gemmatales bacterium]|nr:HEAT repeat domain-containing protein [Gemmatales bacterium]
MNKFKEHAELRESLQELVVLANDEAWYTRRYAVHVLIKYPFFRTPELVKKLQNDPHPLVRDRAKHIKLENQ